MILRALSLLVLLGCARGAPAAEAIETEKSALIPEEKSNQEKDDLNVAASTYGRRYSDWGSGYPGGSSGYGVTGYGLLDDRYNSYYGGLGGYDNSFGYNGYGGYPGNSGYSGYNRGYGNSGYGGYGNSGYGGYGNSGYGASGYGGNGGYGGYGGNGGLNSYYGYNNPYYQGAYHLGYGYNKKPGYGSIYSSGITPSLVTGYRGYSK